MRPTTWMMKKSPMSVVRTREAPFAYLKGGVGKGGVNGEGEWRGKDGVREE